MYMMATEEGVKKLARDYDVYSERKQIKGDEVKKIEGPTNVNRGTKNLMMQIQNEMIKDSVDDQIIENEPIEDVFDDDFPTEELEDYDE